MPEGVEISTRGGKASVLVNGEFALFMVTEDEAEAYVQTLSLQAA